MFCGDEYSLAIFETTRFGLFSPEVPLLVYYSHITAVVVTLLLSVFVISRSRTPAAKTLLAISIAFSALSILDILLWTLIDVGMVMLLWSFWLTLFTLIFCLSFYFLYSFIRKRDLPFIYKLGFAVLIIAIELLSITALNLEYFDLAYCEAGEGVHMINTVFGLSFLVFIAAVVFGTREVRRITDPDQKKSALYATMGVSLFLLIFSFATYLASIVNIIFENGSFEFIVEQYGYFGMTLFIGLMAYTIVRYKAFQIKLIATSALVAALIILVAAQFIFVRSQGGIVLTALTLTLAVSFGVLLIQSVRREVRQREEIEKLVVTLDKANARLKVLDKMKSEFVSIASHQLRSPLTSIRGYASMLLEGSYGTIPPKATEALERISESSKFMVDSVEDYLNVSRIESGNMKYELADFNFKDTVEHVVDEIRPTAMKKGLLLTFRSDLDSKGIVNADVGKVHQALHNLINNSIKYTEKGSVVVSVGENAKRKRVFVTISDTGIGMSQDTIDGLFAKFSRAKNANKTNTAGTGLGLYVAKQMIEQMGGTICCDSEGEGKGSIFTLELPLLQ